MNLLQRGVECDKQCKRCSEKETLRHALWSSSEVQAIWENHALGPMLKHFSGSGMDKLCLFARRFLNKDELEVLQCWYGTFGGLEM